MIVVMVTVVILTVIIVKVIMVTVVIVTVVIVTLVKVAQLFQSFFSPITDIAICRLNQPRGHFI